MPRSCCTGDPRVGVGKWHQPNAAGMTSSSGEMTDAIIFSKNNCVDLPLAEKCRPDLFARSPGREREGSVGGLCGEHFGSFLLYVGNVKLGDVLDMLPHFLANFFFFEKRPALWREDP